MTKVQLGSIMSNNSQGYSFTDADRSKALMTRKNALSLGKLTTKQDKFLRFIAFEGLNPITAYMKAFDCIRKSARARTYKLLNNPAIQARLARYLEDAGKRNEVTIDEVIKTIRSAIRGAEAEGEWGAMITGAKTLGQYLGIFDGKDDRRSNFSQGESDAETRERLAKISRISSQPVPEETVDVEPGKCSECGFVNKEGSKFCEECGSKMQ